MLCTIQFKRYVNIYTLERLAVYQQEEKTRNYSKNVSKQFIFYYIQLFSIIDLA